MAKVNQYKPKKCANKECGKQFIPFNSLQRVCPGNVDCALKFAEQKRKEKERKEYNKQTRQMKRDARSRDDWYALLQTEVNRYVLLRDWDKPCCTCGNMNHNIKYDAGHYRSVGACKSLRFELTNIHKQCSVNCNQFGSGKRLEYQHFLRDKYGQDHLDWLDGPHPDLKKSFPNVEDIEAEIKRFRKMNKEIRNEREI